MKKQILLTPSEGKRLIAKALASDSRVLTAAKEHTLVLGCGTTNGYIADELFPALGLGAFDKNKYYSGVFMGPELKSTPTHHDIVIRKGALLPEHDLYTIQPELESCDLILKGANTLYLQGKEAGVMIGNTAFGKLSAICIAVYGRRVQLILPVGLEKRVDRPIRELEAFVNDPENSGLRLAYAPGAPYTELDALKSTGVRAVLLGGGGVGGYEGSVILGLEGAPEAFEKAEALLAAVKGEPRFGF